MTAQAAVEPKRDRWGRYLLPDPYTEKDRAWTRATTVASTLADRYGLEQWAQRNTILGIAARPDLYALAASCKPEDKDQLNRIAADAQEAAKSRSGANLGTALHRILEGIDSGEDLDVPAEWRGDVDAYCAAGPLDKVRARVEATAERADGLFLTPPTYFISPEELSEFQNRQFDAFDPTA